MSTKFDDDLDLGRMGPRPPRSAEAPPLPPPPSPPKRIREWELPGLSIEERERIRGPRLIRYVRVTRDPHQNTREHVIVKAPNWARDDDEVAEIEAEIARLEEMGFVKEEMSR